MKGLRKILRVSWTAKKTNEWVLNKAGVKRELLETAKARKLAYCGHTMRKLEGKYSLESTDPRESEIRAPPQPLPYLMPIPPNTLFYNKKFITAFLSLGLGNTS